MNILAIDTTTKKANVGLKINNINKISSVDNEITHSEKLLPLIDSTLKENNISLNDIGNFACVTGPGSFTGIRIGLATVKALAKVTGNNIFAMNSLELLAYSASKSTAKIVFSIIDAKNNRGYYGIYSNINGVLSPIYDLGNKYFVDILNDIKNICKKENCNSSDILIVVDSSNSHEYFSQYFSCILSGLDINILLNKAEVENAQYDYLTLDATYVRSSEAERTKYGE